MSANGSLPPANWLQQLAMLQAASNSAAQQAESQQYVDGHLAQQTLNSVGGMLAQEPNAVLAQLALMQQAGRGLRPELFGAALASQAQQQAFANAVALKQQCSVANNNLLNGAFNAAEKAHYESCVKQALAVNQLQRQAVSGATILQSSPDEIRQMCSASLLHCVPNSASLYGGMNFGVGVLPGGDVAFLGGSVPQSVAQWNSPTANNGANVVSKESEKRNSSSAARDRLNQSNGGLDEQLNAHRRTPQHSVAHLNNNNNNIVATPTAKCDLLLASRTNTPASIKPQSPMPTPTSNGRRLPFDLASLNAAKVDDDSHSSANQEPLNLVYCKRDPDLGSDAHEKQRRLFTDNIAQAHQLAPLGSNLLCHTHPNMLSLFPFPLALPPSINAQLRHVAPPCNADSVSVSPNSRKRDSLEISHDAAFRSASASSDLLDVKKPRLGEASMPANIAPLITPLTVSAYEAILNRAVCNGNAQHCTSSAPIVLPQKAAASSPAGSCNSSTLVANTDNCNPLGRAAESGSTSSSCTQPCASPKHPGKLKKHWMDRHETTRAELPGKPGDQSPVTVRTLSNSTASLEKNNTPATSEPQSPPSENPKSVDSVKGSASRSAASANQKQSSEPFLQNAPCYETAPKLVKCRECRVTSDKRLDNLFCRFCDFRKLRYNQKGHLTIAGFSTLQDADAKDIQLWRASQCDVKLTRECALYILDRLGSVFCEMVTAEKAAVQQVLAKSPASAAAAGGNRRLQLSDTSTMQCIGFDGLVEISWKRPVQSVREMCDACKTTLFNMHWVCQKCGYVVCLDCYNARDERPNAADSDQGNCNRAWLTCSVTRKQHQPSCMVLTQVIPADALWLLAQRLHAVAERCHLRRIATDCRCFDNSPCRSVALASQQRGPVSTSPDTFTDEHETNDDSSHSSVSSVTLGAAAATGSLQNGSSVADGGMDALSLLANVATTMQKQPGNTPQSAPAPPAPIRNVTLQNVIDSVVNECVRDSENDLPPASALQRCNTFLISPPGTSRNGLRSDDDACVFDSAKLSASFTTVPHSWLCNGRVLHLHDSSSPVNLDAFQRVWRYGKPVLVSGCQRNSQKDLWTPRTFAKEFGSIQNELVNCRTNLPLPNTVSLRSFWDGFENARKRTNRDSHNEALILKLKDWPAGDDFQDLLPRQYRDLIAALPLSEYTHRNGMLNLAARLPDFFVRPDLGPKLYSAYGTARFPAVGSTNLHTDVSDAVNVLMHVTVESNEDANAAMRYLETNPHLDSESLDRIRSQKLQPGAIWHLFDSRDAPKLRAFLLRVATEKGGSSSGGNGNTEPDHDPIHDQQTYLDSEALGRLRREYGVLPYTIVQCVGDAIFIPAGSPHQVKNLQACVKVALDFVSAEQVSECVQLTSEFRHLSKKHSNHEDKLQIKNMIYHAVKDCVVVLENAS